MASSKTSPATPAVKARRGDLAVIVSRTMTAVVQGKSYENVAVTLGRVSSVTRPGLVKRYEQATSLEGEAREKTVNPRDQVLIVGADDVDVESVLTEYRKHTYRDSTGVDSDMICPYTSLEEARTTIKRFRNM